MKQDSPDRVGTARGRDPSSSTFEPAATDSKRRVIYAFAFAGVLVALVLVLKLLPQNPRVVDERFEVLNCKVSTSTTHEMYDGNQLIGRLNGWVKQKWGVNVTKTGGLVGSGPLQTMILLRYRGRMDSGSLDGLKVFISSDKGFTAELSGLARYMGRDSFIKMFHLKSIGTNAGPFSVSFRLANGEEMAVWRIKHIQSY